MKIRRVDFIPPILTKVYNKINKPLNKYSKINDYSGLLMESYSQYGEDLIIDGIFKNKSAGFYIDIGANDPKTLNNTQRFYNKGWRGINIEPNPILFKEFEKERIYDTNLNIGIGREKSELNFFEMSSHVYSTFNEKSAKEIQAKSKLRIINTYKVAVLTLNDIYKEYVKDSCVDFISIDTEGFEQEILLGNDWIVNRPKLIVIEMGENHDWIFNFFDSKNYQAICFNHVNAFFADKNQAFN